MPYEFQVQVHEDYLRAEVSGARTPGREVHDAVQTGQQISDAVYRSGVSKVLAVFRMTGRLPATESHEIYSNPQAFGWSRDVKVALVDMNPESKEDSLFSETVAVNRAYDMSVFDNEEDALEWLLDTPQPTDTKF
jgi:hypothetical protein